MRLILDTSVLTSASRSPYGGSKLVVDAALQRQFELLLSSSLLLEYESVLTRPHQMAASGLSTAQIEDLLSSLLKVATTINLSEYNGPFSADPNDNHVLSLASQGKADAIVTHNLRHFRQPSHQLGVNLYMPGDVLRILRS